jgi:hypothetical protein
VLSSCEHDKSSSSFKFGEFQFNWMSEKPFLLKDVNEILPNILSVLYNLDNSQYRRLPCNVTKQF